MRELLGLSFLHRERTRYRGRSSDLLDIAFTGSDGVAIDLGRLPELEAIERTPSGVRIGAFAPLHDVSAALPDFVPAGMSAQAARLRLGLLGATVTIAGGGATRTARMESFALAPHECPIAIDVPVPAERFGCADRRRTTSDGDASFALGVAVVLRINERGAFAGVRIAVDLDGVTRRAALAEAKLEGERVDPGRFAEAARLTAYAIEAGEARTSAAARAVTPLTLAALRDAFARARPLEPVGRRGFLGALAGIVALAALPQPLLAQSSDRLDAVRARKVLRVGLTGDYKPFSFVSADGTWEGLDVTVARALAQSLGVDVAFVKTTWPTMAADLRAGAFDVAMGGVSRSADRAAAGLLSRAYVVDGKVALIRAADRARYHTLADFDQPATRVAVNPGGTNAQFVSAHLTHATVTVVEKNLAIPPLVADGTYDVMFTDGVEAAYNVQRDARLAIDDPEHPYTHVEKVYWVPADGPQLLAYINTWMERNERDGTYARWRIAAIGSNVNAP